MLLPYKSFYYSPTHYHLGDIVNVVQQVHHRAIAVPGLHFISSRPCPCCGVDSGEMAKNVLSLLGTSVKYESSKNFISVSPAWVKGHKKTIYDGKYAKAKELPERGDHVVCQFDKRSRGEKIPNNVIDFVKSDMINIGDNKLPCINKTELDLRAKFRMLASAKLYVGVDSGLTHLALMTETPILLIHPKSWDAGRFYPPSPQLRFLEV